eukprot:9491405-Pyramimonas_sp.AAC.2
MPLNRWGIQFFPRWFANASTDAYLAPLRGYFIFRHDICSKSSFVIIKRSLHNVVFPRPRSAFKATDLVDPNSPESWFKQLMTAPGYTVTKESFYTDLHHFLNNTGAYYSADIIFHETDPNVILSSRFTGNHVQLEDSSDKVGPITQAYPQNISHPTNQVSVSAEYSSPRPIALRRRWSGRGQEGVGRGSNVSSTGSSEFWCETVHEGLDGTRGSVRTVVGPLDSRLRAPRTGNWECAPRCFVRRAESPGSGGISP